MVLFVFITRFNNLVLGNRAYRTIMFIVNFLKGKKTYIVSVLMVLVAVVNFFAGDMGLVEFLNSPDVVLLFGGLGFGTMRAGIAKIQ